jgi:hypothetical protein
MNPLQFLVPLEPLAAVEPYVAWLVLALVVVNMATRLLAHRQHVRQAREGDDDELLARSVPHQATTVLLVLASFLFLVVEPHGGMVMSVLVVGMVLADFFEFESRKVEARNELDIDRPNASLTASALVFAYAAFQALFGFVAVYWNAIV